MDLESPIKDDSSGSDQIHTTSLSGELPQSWLARIKNRADEENQGHII